MKTVVACGCYPEEHRFLAYNMIADGTDYEIDKAEDYYR